MKNNYGSEIKFVGKHKGTKKHTKYVWVASAKSNHPTTVFINKCDEYWFKLGDKRMIRFLRHIFSHEPIHCILWDMLGTEKCDGYDYLRKKFTQQIIKECPKSFRDWNTF